MMCFDAIDTGNLINGTKFPTVLKVSFEIFGIYSNLLRSVRLLGSARNSLEKQW